MKFIIFLLILIISFKFVYSNFNNNKCIKEGEECDHWGLNNCQNGYTCQLVNEKDDKYVCKPAIKLGEKCIGYNDMCEDGLGCIEKEFNSKEGTFCLPIKSAELGQSCTRDIECIGYNQCSKGKCTFKTNYPKIEKCRLKYSCPGQQYCNSTECDEREKKYCKNAICKPLEKVGSNCIDSIDCELGLVCSWIGGNGGKCIEKYSFKQGHECNKNDECDINLSCYSGICQVRNQTQTNNCLKEGCYYTDEYCDVETNKCKFEKIMTQECKNAEIKRNKCYQLHDCQFSNVETTYFGGGKLQSKNLCTMKHCEFETLNFYKQCFSLFNHCK